MVDEEVMEDEEVNMQQQQLFGIFVKFCFASGSWIVGLGS